jgi:hypothetical protein
LVIMKYITRMTKYRNIRIILLVVVFICQPNYHSDACDQRPEYLIINGDTNKIYWQYPLKSLIDSDWNFRVRWSHRLQVVGSTGCYRGYIGYWEIRNDSLFLIRLDALDQISEYEYRKYDLKNYFGKRFKNKRVYANWFSDTLRIDSLSIIFKNGIQIDSEIKENEEPENTSKSQVDQLFDDANFMFFSVFTLFIIIVVPIIVVYRRYMKK